MKPILFNKENHRNRAIKPICCLTPILYQNVLYFPHVFVIISTFLTPFVSPVQGLDGPVRATHARETSRNFEVEDYDGEFIEIGNYLSSLTKDESWSKEDFYRIRKKACRQVLPQRRTSMEVSKKEKWNSTSSGVQETRPTKH